MELEALVSSRQDLVKRTAPDLVALYAIVAATRRGTAVVEVRDGHCSACHVRLRPQNVIEIRRSERVFQCESCSRILFVPPDTTTGAAFLTTVRERIPGQFGPGGRMAAAQRLRITPSNRPARVPSFL